MTDNILLVASSASIFVKILVDVIKNGFPNRPTWLAPTIAIVGGIGICLLILLTTGETLTSQSFASATLAGIFAGGGAIGATELQRKADEKTESIM
jgi:hypothetical protein